MRNLRVRLKTPQIDWYDAKITHHNHIANLQVISDTLDGVVENGAEERDMYQQSCFAHFHYMQRGMAFSYDTEVYEDSPNGIHHMYFSGRDMVTLTKLEARIEQGQWQLQFNTVKLYLLYILNCVLISTEVMYSVHIWQLHLVDELDAFNAFPLGSHVYRYSIFRFKKAILYRSPRCNNFELAYALLVFTFEVIPTPAKQFVTLKAIEQPFPYIHENRTYPTEAERGVWYYQRINENTDVAAPSTVYVAPVGPTRVRFRSNTGVVPPTHMVGHDASIVDVDSTYTEHKRGDTAGHTDR
ncbi:hypothetical protein Ddye_000920 [Dipteronia dyeriana]|uniref:Uncharacterized protein n=1 Tax=Dipteronia dyeriana TaxID=168575 RepID=A0AAD9XN43_9ROSI|nr:hypothetical protein Ddye_000920 [Dipteronia dyeriana]